MWPFTKTNQQGSKTSFLLSTAAEVLGVVTFIAGTSQVATGARVGNTAFLGFFILLGAMAYRSLKRTRVGLKRPSAIRRTMEILALLFIAALVLLQNDLGAQVYRDPLTFAIVPLWIFAAYVIMYRRVPAPLPRA